MPIPAASPAAASWPRTLLVGVDGGAAAAAALERSFELAERAPGRIVLATVAPVQPSGLGRRHRQQPSASVLEEHASHLEQARSRALARGHSCVSALLTGEPGPALAAAASEHGVDLIAVGRRRRGALGALLGGGVARYLVREAPCAVLVVPDDAWAAATIPGS